MRKDVRVNLGMRSYAIRIEAGVLGNAGSIVGTVTNSSKFMILSTRKIYEKYGLRD